MLGVCGVWWANKSKREELSWRSHSTEKQRFVTSKLVALWRKI